MYSKKYVHGVNFFFSCVCGAVVDVISLLRTSSKSAVLCNAVQYNAVYIDNYMSIVDFNQSINQ